MSKEIKTAQYLTRTPFSPEPGKIYERASPSGGRFYCESRPSGSLFNAWLTNARSGWHFLAHGVGIYPDGRIDWDYSTDGRFETPPVIYENERYQCIRITTE